MNSVEKFNSLNGKKVSRNELRDISHLALAEKQSEVYNRIQYLFEDYPNAEYFKLSIATPAVFDSSVVTDEIFDNSQDNKGLGATLKRWKKSYKKHQISWSEKEKRYIIKHKNKRIYDVETEQDAYNWIDRNSSLNAPKKKPLQKYKSIIKSLKDDKDYISHEIFKATFNGKSQQVVNVYTKKRHVSNNNRFGLDTFSSEKGHGFVIPLEKATMPKALAASQHEGLAKDALSECGRLKPGYRYVKGGKIVKASLKVKYTKAQIIKHLSALSLNQFANHYAYSFSADLDKVKYRIEDKATHEKYILLLAEKVVNDDRYLSVIGIDKKKPKNVALLIEKKLNPKKLSNTQIEQIGKEYASDILWKEDIKNYFNDVLAEKKARNKQISTRKTKQTLFDFIYEVSNNGGYKIKTFLDLDTNNSVKFDSNSDNIKGLKYYKATEKGLKDLKNKHALNAYGDKQTLSSKHLKKKDSSQLALFGYVQTEILELPDTYKNKSVTELRDIAKLAYKSFVLKKVFNESEKLEIEFAKIGLKETLWHNQRKLNSRLILAITKLPEVLKYAKLIKKSSPKPSHISKYKAIRILTFEGKIKIDNKVDYYVITVFETKNKNLKYFIEKASIKKSIRTRSSNLNKRSALPNGLSKSKTTKNNNTTKKSLSKRKKLGTVLIDLVPTPTHAATENQMVAAAQLDNTTPIYKEPETTSEETFNKTETETPKGLKGLKKLGFDIASEGPSKKIETFNLPGEIGKLIQVIQPHKALILIKGTKHTSKSQLAMQIANAFGELEMPVAYIDYEQGGLESKDTQNSVKWNTTPSGRNHIGIIGYLENPFEELKKYCQYCKVVIADSVTDLGITADQLNTLRSDYTDVIWVFISQVKENGEMYGGNKMAHNPTVIIQCHPSKEPEKRYATLIKNRGNDLNIAYSIFEKRIINVEEFTSTSPQIPSSVML